MNAVQDSVDRNYEAFKKLLPGIIEKHQGRFALMRDEQLIALFDTANDAATAGDKLFEDGLFSIQEVTTRRISLGFYSYA